MSFRMDLTLTGDTFTDELHADVGASAFQLDHDWFTRQDLVIRTASGGGGTLLVEGTDYTLSEESTELSTRVSAAVGSGRNVFHLIAVINVTYQTGNLYFSGKYIADSVAAEDVNTLYDGLPLVRGAIVGLTLSNNSGDANNDIDIAAGRVLADGATDVLILAAALTKRFDASWVVGSGNGGMDTGTKPVSGWFYVYVIKRPDTGVVDAIGSLNASTPSPMPAGYTLDRRIGARRTDGSGNILGVEQFGDECRYKALITDRTGAIANTTRNLQTVTIPPGMIGIFNVGGASASGQSYIWIASTGFTDAAASSSYRTLVEYSTVETVMEVTIPVDVSSQIAYRSNSTNGTLYIYTLGWIDRRGKDEAA